ncbi:MAG: hypothetical protein F6J98_08840 [Moorea sp. SIO4G2]|nr:hypothetical protein [Moorena sp. SIO4G2]
MLSYGLRNDYEENFLDDQSSGWNLQKSEIRDASALSRLWFILAVATLCLDAKREWGKPPVPLLDRYVSAQGVAVVESGQRRWVDTHWFRGNSYFRIGWDWVKAAKVNGWTLIKQVQFSSNQDPSPAMASRKQYEQRLYRLEFQIQTYQYAVT